ncbi:MAG: hypothetical protein K1X55_17285 [Chitinophagales bacterium]|nr:hypothetical protein [Chitinophagales bacterium]
MRNLFRFLCIIAIFSFANCGKKTATVPKHLVIDSFLLNNFNYAAGSYWVYRDSLTGALDSFSVIDNTFTSIPISSDNSLLNDAFAVTINQYNSSNAFIAKWRMDVTGGSINLFYFGTSYIDYDFLLVLPIKVGVIAAGNSTTDSAYNISIKDTITVDSSKYYEIVKYRHFKKNTPIYDNVIYYSKYVGILKLDLNQEDMRKILEIKRYKIIKK